MRLTLAIILFPLVAFGQEQCNRLFYQLDPVNMSIGTQSLIIEEINDCLQSQFPPNQVPTIYDKYYRGLTSDLNAQVATAFDDPFDMLDQNNQGISQLSNINLSTATLDPRPIISLSPEDQKGIQGTGQSPSINDQYIRLLGNLSDDFFIGLFDEMPQELSHLIWEAGARKLAWYGALNRDLFQEASTRSDSTNYLHKNIHRPIGNRVGTDRYTTYSRLTMSYILANIHQVDSVLQSANFLAEAQQSINNSNSSFAETADSVFIKANDEYSDYRDSTMNAFAESWSQLVENTLLNLDRIEIIQAYFSGISIQMQSIANSIASDSTNEQLRNDHFELLNKSILGKDYVDAYLKGNLDVQAFVRELRALGIDDPQVLMAAEGLRTTEDITAVLNFENSFSKLKKGFSEGAPSVIAGTTFGSIAVAGGILGVRKTLKDAGGIKKLFRDRQKRKAIFKAGLSGFAKMGARLVSGFIASQLLGDILQEQVTKPILEQMDILRQEMNARFSVIDQKLNQIVKIQLKTSELVLDGIQFNREIMQYQFNNINIQLDDILDNQSQMISQLQNLLVSELNLCPGAAADIIATNPLNRYSDLITGFNNISGASDCISGLRIALDGTLDNSACADISKFVVTPSSPYAIQELDNFEKAAELFKVLYSGNQSQQAQNLLIHLGDMNSLNWIESYVNKESYDFGIESSEMLLRTNYVDVTRLSKIISYYTIFQPYIEVFTSSNNTAPLSVEDYLALAETDRNTRINSNKRHIDNLLCIVNIAIAQQALISGHSLIENIYEIIHKAEYDGTVINYNTEVIPIRQFVVDMLHQNPLLASNFATYTINKHMRFSERNTSKMGLESDDKVRNGDFDFGPVGFFSMYPYLRHFSTDQAHSVYSINTSPRNFSGGFEDFGDRTSGSGNMLIVDPGGAGDVAWENSVTLAGGRTYDFKFSYTCVTDEALFTQDSDRQISFALNGQNIQIYNVGINPGLWRDVTYEFTVPETKTYQFQLLFEGTMFPSNIRGQFALDAISLRNKLNPGQSIQNHKTRDLLNRDVLYTFGYDNTGGVSYPLEEDTIIYGLNSISADTNELKSITTPNILKYGKQSVGGVDVVTLLVAAESGCSTSVGGIQCSAVIPFPPFEQVISNDLKYSEAYQVMDAQRQKVYDLHTNIHLPSYYQNDWISKQLYKVILLENAK